MLLAEPIRSGKRPTRAKQRSKTEVGRLWAANEHIDLAAANWRILRAMFGGLQRATALDAVIAHHKQTGRPLSATQLLTLRKDSSEQLRASVAKLPSNPRNAAAKEGLDQYFNLMFIVDTLAPQYGPLGALARAEMIDLVSWMRDRMRKPVEADSLADLTSDDEIRSRFTGAIVEYLEHSRRGAQVRQLAR